MQRLKAENGQDTETEEGNLSPDAEDKAILDF